MYNSYRNRDDEYEQKLHGHAEIIHNFVVQLEIATTNDYYITCMAS